MAKVDPVTGQCNRDSRGKVVKPLGWVAPDVVGEIRKQMNEGSF
jgi:hypothetical protein